MYSNEEWLCKLELVQDEQDPNRKYSSAAGAWISWRHVDPFLPIRGYWGQVVSVLMCHYFCFCHSVNRQKSNLPNSFILIAFLEGLDLWNQVIKTKWRKKQMHNWDMNANRWRQELDVSSPLLVWNCHSIKRGWCSVLRTSEKEMTLDSNTIWTIISHYCQRHSVECWQTTVPIIVWKKCVSLSREDIPPSPLHLKKWPF